MVIGIIPDPASVQTLLNNLHEAGYADRDVSILMRDPGVCKSGPFKGMGSGQLPSKLAHAGLPAQEASVYADAVGKGKAFVAIRAEKAGEKAAAEMLGDYAPEMVRIF